MKNASGKTFIHHVRNMIMLMMLLMCVSACLSEDNDSDSNQVKPGETIPTFSVAVEINDTSDWRYNTVENYSFNTYSVRSHEATVIVFFNTGCSDCQRELPTIQQFYDLIKADNSYELVCVSREENEEGIRKYWQKESLTLPYSPQTNRAIYNMFASIGIPRTYIINKYGVVTNVYTDTDELSLQTLMKVINKEL